MSAVPYPTKTRLALLHAVADGEVWRYRDDGDSRGTLGQLVNARIAELEAAGWVHLVELQSITARELGYRQWQLTDAGRAVLADAGADR